MREADRYLYRAPFVVPVVSPVIEDGAVLTEKGRVVAVGRFVDLKGEAAELVDYEGQVITPPLVNGHAHLELSWLAELGRGREEVEPGDLTGWIDRLLNARERNSCSPEDQRQAALMALARLYAGGCRAVADIGNQEESGLLGEGFKTKVHFFLEVLGLGRRESARARELLAALAPEVSCTAHAPYSTDPDLIQALKERARDQVFPIHTAESADEIEFLATGRGRLRDFLERRGVWDNTFRPPGTSAVAYLDSLGVLDHRTLCVHAVQVTDDEIDLLARRGSRVCLCPGSNRCLGVGKAPAPRYLARGILPALGTDSLASNPVLNLWQEMRILRQDHPGLEPETVFKMATIGGAHALGLDPRAAAIAPGSSAALLAVRCAAGDRAGILEHLTTAGTDIALEWIE